ncbi:L,D-transpeptidase [uncultured Thiodictyon sp.]|uniref:L,D-transpeptidase n=1 Tax=uncultured Thiodictyon sp. TaxID=1846217 RepID=UPI0025E321BA|nr:L,D-transpeptidase [uncultured Thiodictyon sp.]
MHNPRQTFLPPALACALLGALLNGGCALVSRDGEVPTPPAQTDSAVVDENVVALVKNTPPVKPANDHRYQLPPAQSRDLTVFIDTQTFEYVEDGQTVLSGPVSSGNAQHPTPTGDYRVLTKQIDKRSGKYTNDFNQPTPMPYSLQFRGPYFVHEGWVPGYPDSHGCIRLRYEDARLLFDRIQLGDPILVKRAGAARVASPDLANPQPPGLWAQLVSAFSS